MGLTVSQREKEGVAILDLAGALTAGDAATELRRALLESVSAGRNNVVLNLAEVDYIDSTGLGGMVVCYTTLRKSGGRLVLLNLIRRHLELLVLTKLSTVFELFDDEQNAVNSFFPNRSIRHFDILSFVNQQRRDDPADDVPSVP
jgi:anti-sigma B factor antagonist